MITLKAFKHWITAGVVALLCCQSVQALNRFPAPTLKPTPPNVAAKAYFLVDTTTGVILASKNPEAKMAPASLTKLMTLYITFGALESGQLKLDDEVTISEKAWRMPGSRMFLKPHSRVSVDLLLQGVITVSGNDACEALAEHLAGSSEAFAQIMNETAQQLGMTHSHFMNSSGLPHKDHYTSAKDLAKLASAIINQYPQYYHYFAQKWLRFNKIKQPNRNRLLWRDRSVDGLKTGHTESAGYCLVSSAQRDKMRLVSVVMGAKTDAARASISQRLLNFGFRFYTTHELFPANTSLSQVPVWMGKQKTMDLGLTSPLAVTIRSSDYPKLQAEITTNPEIKAPIRKGQAFGKITIRLGNEVLTERDLVALRDDNQSSWWFRTIDKIKLGLKHLL